MERVILVRHAESEFSVRAACNGDPRRAVALTENGRAQAQALGRLLADDPLDLCVTSEFQRARETADVALAGRVVTRLVVPELNDILVGRFEGGALSDYRAWAHAHGPLDECPGGGESRAAAATRFAAGFRSVLDRQERSAVVIGHSLPISYVLAALLEQDPTAVVEPVAYAEPHRLSAAQLRRAVERLERWLAAPAFV